LTRPVRQLEWGYYISNAIALTRDELTMSPTRQMHYPHIDAASEDAHAHTVRFRCQRLELLLALQGSALRREDIRVLVERRAEDDADAAWLSDPNETARLENRIEAKEEADGVTYWALVVDGPIVGRRYSLVFKPADTKRRYPKKAERLSKRALTECRGKPIDEGHCPKCDDVTTGDGKSHDQTRKKQLPLRRALTAALDDVFKAVLGEPVDEWCAHLWDSEDRALLPAFGRFHPHAWGNYFEAGVGVVGHAFRHGRTVAWRHDQGEERTQTIFRKDRAQPGHRDPGYKWVLCMPFRLAQDGTSIGVIGVARSSSASTNAEQVCESVVDSIVNVEEPHEMLKQLEMQTHVAFWTALSNAPELSEEQRAYARKCVVPPDVAPT